MIYHKYFENAKEFITESRRFGIPEDNIQHELSHYNEAINLGYRLVFKILFIPKRAYIEFNLNEIIRDEDIIKISLAPKNPSKFDLTMAEEAKQRLKAK